MDDENERTLYVGNLGDQVSEENLWELFLQVSDNGRIYEWTKTFIPAASETRSIRVKMFGSVLLQWCFRLQ